MKGGSGIVTWPCLGAGPGGSRHRSSGIGRLSTCDLRERLGASGTQGRSWPSIPEDRLSIFSYGKERPQCSDSD